MSIYVVMPAYNEEENIESVIKQWYPILEGKGADSRLVIADSGSTDSTHQILLEMQKQYPMLEILSNTGKKHGPKLMALYDYAITHGADYIFQTDSDGQTSSSEFEEFWNNRESFDAILGYRPVRGDGRMRAFVEKVVCCLLRIYFGIKVPDANAPFRLMQTSLVKKYLYNLPKDYNLPNIMLTTYFAFYKENIRFEEITFKSRQGGINSINILKIIKIGWRALNDFNVFRKQMKHSKQSNL